MKITCIRFDTIRGGDVIAVAAPPSGDDESHLWRIRGDVIREAAGFPLASVSAGSRIRIIVELNSDRPPSRPVWLGASVYSSHILGPVADRRIEPSEWRDRRCKVIFERDGSVLGANGVDEHHVSWQWHWRDDAEREVNDLGLSEHLLFITIGLPTEPWSDSGASTGRLTAPWAGALRQACQWARGATSPRDAASCIIRSLFALGETGSGEPRVKYYPDLANYVRPNMGNPRWFNCELFLIHFADIDRRIAVNCYEGASVALTFANLLGCSLALCVIESSRGCGEFGLNRIQPLGGTGEKAPRAFVTHVVLLQEHEKSGIGDDLAYDAVLRIDEGPDPGDDEGRFVIVDGIPLGASHTSPGSGHYLPQLIASRSIRACRTRSLERPWVGARPRQTSVRPCPLVRYTRFLWALQAARHSASSMSGSKMPDISGYRRHEEYSRQPGLPREELPRLPLVTQLLFTSKLDDTKVVQVDWWTDEDPWITLSFMAELLAMSEIPVEPVTVRGGPAYTVARHTSLIVLYEGTVIQLSAIGRSSDDMVDLYQSGVIVQ